MKKAPDYFSTLLVFLQSWELLLDYLELGQGGLTNNIISGISPPGFVVPLSKYFS